MIVTDRRNIYFFYKKRRNRRAVQKLKQLAEEHGFRVVHHHNEANIIASIGGDGTFCRLFERRTSGMTACT